MHCPKCGQQQLSEDTRFCSRCGFLLTGVAEVVANGGILPGGHRSISRSVSTPRNTGLKQGLFIFLLSFLLVPLAIMISLGIDGPPVVAIMLAICLTAGGMLRMAFALMFESNNPGGKTPLEQNTAASPDFSNKQTTPNELSPQQSIPVSAYVSPGTGAWRDTNDLNEPGSVTDSTTKLLQKEREF